MAHDFPDVMTHESRSVLEQSNIDELLATVEIKTEEWETAYGVSEVVEVDDGPVLLDMNAPLVEAENAAAQSREMLSIPRRPQWHEGMPVEELAALESEAFMEWRRGLKQLQHDGGLVMTPYERNLDFWRQLWRCIERSHLLVQVLDARDPDFYFCQDLYRYVSELGGSKRLLLLINKADYLSKEQRQKWADHFEAKGVEALFFSALNEVQKQGSEECHKMSRSERKKAAGAEAEAEATDFGSSVEAKAATTRPFHLDAVSIPVPDSSDDDLAEGEPQAEANASGAGDTSSSEDEEEAPRGLSLDDTDSGVLDVARLLDELRARLASSQGADSDRQGVIGFVGYPNVGKSTVINALVGAKKVAMSRTPGKTKHIQTIQLPEWGFIVCDAPGLVFPSVVATRAHLVINNTIPLDDLRECWEPIRLIVEKIGFAEVLRRYKCAQYVKDAAARIGVDYLDEAHSFLAAFAVSRNHFLWVGVPDENWAARKVLRDYCSGKLLHCEPPPGSAVGSSPTSGTCVPKPETEEGAPRKDEGDSDDFDDLNEMLDEAASSMVQTKMTKRKERYLMKQCGKGVVPNSGGKKKGYHKSKQAGENARATTLALDWEKLST